MRFLKNFLDNSLFWDFENKKEIIGLDNFSIFGWYMLFNNKFSSLYVLNKKLILQYGLDVIEIEADDRADVVFKNGVYYFKIIRNNMSLLDFSYKVVPFGSISPFEFIDEEDFNWGFFLLNVINNIERRKNYIEQMTV